MQNNYEPNALNNLSISYTQTTAATATTSTAQQNAADLELSDIFYTNQRKGRVFRVRLNNKGFTLKSESPAGVKEQLVNMRDIVGARCMRLQKQRRLLVCSCSSKSNSKAKEQTTPPTELPLTRLDESAYLYVFAYILKKRLRNSWRRERTVLTLRFRSFDTFEENMHEAERWYCALHWHKRQHMLPSGVMDLRDRHVLVLLNPKSGAGKARKLFLQEVTPILNEAELNYELHMTQHVNYARDFVRTVDLTAFSGIVAIGGDGIFFEILNGLLKRPDWQHVIQHTALGIVPCGSGNGIARSIAHMFKEPFFPKPVLGAALSIISGKTALMDVVRIQLENEVLYSCLSVGWGLISDIDIESECLRVLGYQRFTLWTLHRLISLRAYQGKVAYHLKENQGIDGAATLPNDRELSALKHSQSYGAFLNQSLLSAQTLKPNGSTGCLDEDARTEYAEVISLDTSQDLSFPSRCNSWLSVESHKSAYYSLSGSIYQSVMNNSSIMPTPTATPRQRTTFKCQEERHAIFQKPLPADWLEEEGEFVMVHAAYQSHLGADCNFAPQAKLHDGTIYLIIIRAGINRTQLLNFLVNMSKGKHVPLDKKEPSSEYIQILPVTAFRILPENADGILTVDGERVSFGGLQAEILPGMVQVMVPK